MKGVRESFNQVYCQTADIVLAGTHVGYMSKEAALDLGLISSVSEVSEETLPISIASPIIDAHAGALSMCMFSHELKEVEDQHLDYDNMWCMIGGTSTCDFISTHQRYFTQGVWGPYYDAIFPGYYVREAGQSTTGILMEHVIKAHPDYHNIHKDKPIHEVIKYLNEKLLKKPYMNRLNVNPCYHGSRLLALPSLRGLSPIRNVFKSKSFDKSMKMTPIFNIAFILSIEWHLCHSLSLPIQTSTLSVCDKMIGIIDVNAVNQKGINSSIG